MVLGGLRKEPGFVSKCSDTGASRGVLGGGRPHWISPLRVPSGCREGMERKVAGLDVKRQVRWPLQGLKPLFPRVVPQS